MKKILFVGVVFILLVFSLFSSIDVHFVSGKKIDSYGSIDYVKEGWFLVNKSDIGSYLDIYYFKQSNKWKFMVIPKMELINEAKKIKPDFNRLSNIKYRENLKRIDEYPVVLQRMEYDNNTFEECYINVSVKKINLLSGLSVFDFDNLDLDHNQYRLKIGFHSVTYDSGVNTITVTGNSSDNDAWNFEDLYQADQANGWNVIERQGTTQYYIKCKIMVGDGTNVTYFADKDKQITFWDAGISGYTYFRTQANAVATFGQVDNETLKTTSHGCFFFTSTTKWSYPLHRGSGKIYLYGCGLAGNANTIPLVTRAWGTFYGSHAEPFLNGNNYMLLGAGITRFVIRFGTASNVYVVCNGNILRAVGAYDVSINNVVATTSGSVSVEMDARGKTCTATDVDLNKWTFHWTSAGTFYRYYTFNVKVVDKDGSPIENATVTMKDKEGNEVFSALTGSDGCLLSDESILYGFYNDTGGDTLYSYSPHTLIINKTGYQTYVSTFDVDRSLNLIVTLANRSWNDSEHVAWKIVNSTDYTILKLTSNGNLAIAGNLSEYTDDIPSDVIFSMNNSLSLTESGKLYIKGKLSEQSEFFDLNSSIFLLLSGIIYLFCIVFCNRSRR